ncbi:MAG: hypothetical protein LBG61_05995 [Burkholderiales bacterium]|nr:hypothetical protein [Burkholderiales bacterium]
MKTLTSLLLALAILSVLSGCVTTSPSSSPSSDKPASSPPSPYGGYDSGGSSAPPPKDNLSGFAPEYRQGYTEGCESAKGREHRNAERFSKDADYRMGWQDGYSVCARRLGK